MDELLISCAYNQFERVRRLLEDNGAVIQNTDFGTDVLLETLLSHDKSSAFREALTELTACTATCDCVGSTFRGVRVR